MPAAPSNLNLQTERSEARPCAALSHVACDSRCSCNGGLVTTVVCQISQGNTNVALVTVRFVMGVC